jgi:hypothetical protein
MENILPKGAHGASYAGGGVYGAHPPDPYGGLPSPSHASVVGLRSLPPYHAPPLPPPTRNQYPTYTSPWLVRVRWWPGPSEAWVMGPSCGRDRLQSPLLLWKVGRKRCRAGTAPANETLSGREMSPRRGKFGAMSGNLAEYLSAGWQDNCPIV